MASALPPSHLSSTRTISARRAASSFAPATRHHARIAQRSRVSASVAAPRGQGTLEQQQQASDAPSSWADKVRAATCAGALALVATLALTAGPASAFDEAGKQVFNGNCAACHQGGRNSVMPERTLDKDAISKYLTGGFALDAIRYQVENGKGAMPAWQDRLDEDEIAAVVQYVYEVANAGAWDSQ